MTDLEMYEYSQRIMRLVDAPRLMSIRAAPPPPAFEEFLQCETPPPNRDTLFLG